MAKLFVNYSGTLSSFLSATDNGVKLTEKYNNSIVFIGNGEAVYTHGQFYGNVKEALTAVQNLVNDLKYFSGIKAGETTASAVGKDGIISFNATDPTVVSIDVNTKGVNIGLSEAFKNTVNTNSTNISNLASNIGTKTDSADSEGSAFARIALLKADVSSITGGSGSIATQIETAFKTLDVDAVEGDYVTSIKLVDGKINATMGTFNFETAGAAATAKAEVIGASTDASTANTVYGAKKYAEEKASAAETAANSYADGLVATGSALELRVAANEDAIEVLNGEGDGSIKKAVADGIATVVAGADADFDTLKEVADWIASDTTGAAKMQTDIATLMGADTVTGSVAKLVKDAVTAEAGIARAAEKANADAIDAIEADYLKTSDKTELSNAINNKVSLSDYDTKVAALEKADTDNLAAAKKYADDAILALDVTDTAVENQFVTAVSETDGKITVSRAGISASQITITNTEEDAFAAGTTNVQAALNELANMWAWEEL